MSVTDYVVDIALILIIFRQTRTRELTARNAVLPLLIIFWAGQHYLRGFSVGGNDLALIATLTVIGLGLGSWSGLATRVWRDANGIILARAGGAAVATWIVGMGFRFLFALYVNTAAGEQALGRFSAAHAITSAQAWTTALVLMAFAEVLARVGILQVRRWKLTQPAPQQVTV